MTDDLHDNRGRQTSMGFRSAATQLDTYTTINEKEKERERRKN